ncbi:MAG: SH3 domain-containing protein [Candidatus Methylomirabilales bacterium]
MFRIGGFRLPHPFLTSIVFVCIPGVFLSACAGKTAQPRLHEHVARQTAANRELKEKVATLQLRLLEKETQNRELQKKLDEAIQEVVRAKAKLHSLESKAEAASVIAEAEVALKALKANTGEEEGSEVTQAEQLLKMSAREFKKQNYGGALYLTGQAKGLIKMGAARVRSREKIPMRAGEVLFALPLPLQVRRTSNVREGPGLGFEVLFNLEQGTRLIGYSYKDQWVRVKDENGRGGWIFHMLVDRKDGRDSQ